MKHNFAIGVLGGLVGFGMLFILLSVAGLVGARGADIPRDQAQPESVSAATPLTSTFTYQGQLKNGGTAVNGSCQMAFRLYDALVSGSLIGSPITTTVPVTNGLFTVGLNFGSNAFDGNGRWLDIQVNCTGTFAPLPRQALTPAPYALFATKAPWSGLSGIPAGFADGVDNGSSYQNVKVVAKSGGDFTSITAALNSIADASASNRYLIWVAPGVYTETVTMKPFVDIEGAGELMTRITFTGSASATTGTLLGATNAELRFLTVENTGGAAWAVAIFNSGAAPRLTHVTASASGGTNNIGVYNYAFSSPTMTNVTASASGGSFENIGVVNDSSSPTINNSVVSASGVTGTRYGIFNIAFSGGSYIVQVNNSQISGTGSTIRNDPTFTTYVGSSQLSGGTVTGGGMVYCIGVYDEWMSALTYTSCP